MTGTDNTSRLPLDTEASRTAKPLMAFMFACRPRQWAKNLLIAVPVLVSQQWIEPTHWITLALAFACFSVTASGTYLVNDVLDLRADRAHPIKKHRPFASGVLRPGVGVVAAIVMVVGALVASWVLLPPLFVWSLGVYVILTLAYSLWVKRKAMLDVIWLACLYCLRIIAGGMAVNIIPSAWLLAFALFIFLSLAFAKRYCELVIMEEIEVARPSGRAYLVEDLTLLSTMGVASGYLAVLVLALYINSEAVTELYAQPQVLWLICPAMLYWISRFWLLVHRRLVREDPLLYVLSDRLSYIIGAVVVAVALVADRVVQWFPGG